MRDDGTYKGVSYPVQDVAARCAWAKLQARAPYLLMPIPARPGKRPARWRWFARRAWERQRDARHAAKAWNFGALYGARPRDAWEQMFPPGKRA